MVRPIALAALGALCAAPVFAEPVSAEHGGRLGTLQPGRYLCEVPGDAAGAASVPVAGAWFDVKKASRYSAEGGSGTYLLTGDRVVFTRGPMKGATFDRVSKRRLERTDLAGERTKMRCVRTGRAE